MKLKIDLIDHNLEAVKTMDIECNKYPFELEIIRVQLYNPDSPQKIKKSETKLFYIKR